eukprot:COSAG02_NODE_223_length_28346_cov_91.381846_5_plen_63_part_00
MPILIPIVGVDQEVHVRLSGGGGAAWEGAARAFRWCEGGRGPALLVAGLLAAGCIGARESGR